MAPRNQRVAPESKVRGPTRSFVESLDNFYAPARDRVGEQALQQGFADLSGAIEPFMANAKKRRNDEEYIQGVRDAMAEEADMELQGVRSGNILRQHSPYYMQGLNETRGRASAAQFRDHLSRSYQEWDGRFADDDGSAFRQWMNSQIAEFTQGLGNNPQMLAGALPTVQEVANNFAVQHTSFTNERLQEEETLGYNNIYQDIFGQLGSTMTEEQVSEQIFTYLDDHYQGGNPQANRVLIDSAIAYAREHDTIAPLMIIGRAHQAGRFNINADNQDRIFNAIDAVENQIAANETESNRRLTQEEQRIHNETLNAYAQALQEDPSAAIPATNNHNTLRAAHTLRNTVRAALDTSKPEAPSSAMIDFRIAMSAATPEEAQRLLREFTTQYQLSSTELNGFIDQFIQEDERFDITDSDPAQEIREANMTRFDLAFASVFEIVGDRAGAVANSYEGLFNHYLRNLANENPNLDLNSDSDVRNMAMQAHRLAVRDIAERYDSTIATLLNPDAVMPQSQSVPLAETGLPQAYEETQQAARQASRDSLNNVVGENTPAFEQEGDIPVIRTQEEAQQLQPGDTFRDTNGRTFEVNPDGSYRFIEEQQPEGGSDLTTPDNDQGASVQEEPSLIDRMLSAFTDGVDGRSSRRAEYTPPTGGFSVGEGPMTIHRETRATVRPTASRPNISMDFNASASGGARGTEVIIPDNATPEMRAAAEQFNTLVAEFARANGIEDYPIRGVRTRSENGRGISNTIHVEPFFNDDADMSRAILANPEGFAAIYQAAFGHIPANLIAPHGEGRDRGAASEFFGDETSFGEMIVDALSSQSRQSPQPRRTAEVTPQATPRQTTVGRLGPVGTPPPAAINTRVGPVANSGIGVTEELRTRVASMTSNPEQQQAIVQYIEQNPQVDWVPVMTNTGEVMLVSNDFLRDDSGNYIRGSAANARAIAQELGARLPETPEEVDAIFAWATRPAQFLSSGEFAGEYPSGSNFERLNQLHNQRLAEMGIDVGREDLAAGHMKTVMSNGGIYLNGVQPFRVAHGSGYADYSQGIRLIAPVTF